MAFYSLENEIYRPQLIKCAASLIASVSLILMQTLAPCAVRAKELIDYTVQLHNRIAIENFGEVSKTVWRGASPSDAALKDLASRGIKTVIDLRYSGTGCEHEKKLANRLGLKYIHMPIGFNKLSHKEIVAFLKVVRNPANLPVFIHCRQGADRTGGLVAAYRILVQNWTFEKTYGEMRHYHFKPWLIGMKRSIASFADDKLAKEAVEVALNNDNLAIAGIGETLSP